jgi:hypothetical protein
MSQTNVGPDRGSTTSTPPGTPRWVKVLGIIAIVLILLFVVLHLTGNNLGCPPPGGLHTPPGCPADTPSGDAGDTPFVTRMATPPVEYGVRPT